MNKFESKKFPSEVVKLTEGMSTKKENIANCFSSLFFSIETIPQKSILKFIVDGVPHKVSGRCGQTLYWLLKHHKQGITAKSVCNTAWRLANYIFGLRHRHNLTIEMIYEPHRGGKHGRYFLKSEIKLTDIIINGKNLL